MDKVVRQPIAISVIEVAMFYTSLPGLCIYVQLSNTPGQDASMLSIGMAIMIMVAQWVMAWWLLDAKLAQVRRLLLFVGVAPLLCSLLSVLIDASMRAPANYFAIAYLLVLGGVIPIYLFRSQAVKRFERSLSLH